MAKPNDLVQGTLDLLILKTLSLEPKHGWAIAKRIQQISGEVLQVQQGSLYPALHRLEQKAWIKARWKETETGRQAKFYSLTAAGRAQLDLAQGRDAGSVGLGTGRANGPGPAPCIPYASEKCRLHCNRNTYPCPGNRRKHSDLSVARWRAAAELAGLGSSVPSIGGDQG